MQAHSDKKAYLMEKKGVVKNIIFLTGARFFSNFTLALLGIFVAQYLKPEKFGIYSTGFAFAGIFAIFTEIGIAQVLIRDDSYYPGRLRELLGNALALKTFFGLLVFVACFFCLTLTNYDNITKRFIIWLSIGLVLFRGITYTIFLSLYQITGRLHTLSILETFLTLFHIFLFSAIIIGKFPLIYFAYSYTIVMILAAVIKGGFLRSVLCSSFYTVKHSIYLIKECIVFALSNFFAAIYMQLSIVLLSMISTKAEVGYFSAPYRLMVALYIIPNVVYTVILPKTFHMGKHQLPLLRDTYRLFFRSMIVLAVPITIFLLWFARPIILFLLGEEYLPSVAVLLIMGWVVIFKFVSFSSGIVLTSINKQNERTAIQGFIAFFNVLANLILIAVYQAKGAAMAMLLSEILLALLYTARAFKHGLKISFLSDVKTPLLIGLIFLLCAYLLAHLLHFILAGIISFAIYMLALVIVDYFSETEKNIVLSIISRS